MCDVDVRQVCANLTAMSGSPLLQNVVDGMAWSNTGSAAMNGQYVTVVKEIGDSKVLVQSAQGLLCVRPDQIKHPPPKRLCSLSPRRRTRVSTCCFRFHRSATATSGGFRPTRLSR